MFTLRKALLVLSAAFVLASTANAQQPIFQHQQERIWRLENLGLLTGPSNDSARAIVDAMRNAKHFLPKRTLPP